MVRVAFECKEDGRQSCSARECDDMEKDGTLRPVEPLEDPTSNKASYGVSEQLRKESKMALLIE